ncbi:MAG: PASTA domain-containing protein [Clostridia bacterium]|jgi:serine/threonine protein kinase|nr:PASTA domain-containing protein [Clostridia bacterium]
MLTGKVPFDADTPVSVALKHMQEVPKEPINLNPAIPLSANKIVMKAMKKDPNLRYQSATEMLKDLTLALKNPDGDFVTINSTDEDFPTQVIPTLDNKKIEDKIKEQDKKKKKNFFQNHKALTIILILISIFLISFGGITFLFNGTKTQDIQVPKLVELTEQEANEQIKGTKLTIKIAEEKYDANIEAGKIISQKPEFKENYKIKENTVIEVVISKGQKISIVPKVVGLKEAEAIKMLEDEDLEVSVEEEFNKKIEKEYVISQDIEATKEVPAGSTVKIVVSKGIEEVDVPNVVRKDKR